MQPSSYKMKHFQSCKYLQLVEVNLAITPLLWVRHHVDEVRKFKGITKVNQIIVDYEVSPCPWEYNTGFT